MYKLENNKRYFCDTHTHSNRSDGIKSRREVIQCAINENKDGMMILAISDHNIPFDDITILQEEFKNRILLVPGCEVSVDYVVPNTRKKIEVHINAIDYQLHNEEFLTMLKRNQHDKREYVEKILSKLETVGIHVVDTYEELVNFAKPSKHVGRMVIARMMLKKGLVGNIDEAFELYFGSHGERKCYVENPFEYVPLDEAVLQMRKANAIPVLCHPYSYELENDELMKLICDFKGAGGLAIEAEYGRYSDEQRRSLRDLASLFGLGISAGSDYHSDQDSLNFKFPGRIYEELIALKNRENLKYMHKEYSFQEGRGIL